VRGERGTTRTAGVRLITHLLLFTACGVTPLTNHVKIGEEPFVIVVGEGPDRQTDLFAAPAGGGTFFRLTFSPPEERFPAIAPAGDKVAFLRAAGGRRGPPWALVILDLLTNGESVSLLPPEAGAPERVGWSRDGSRVVVSAGGFFARPVTSEERFLRGVPEDSSALADSVSRPLLGEPPRGVVRECASGGLCIVAATGEITPLDSGATGATRWGADSVGYFMGSAFEVRPLAGGTARRPAWTASPAGLRQLTHHPGPQVTTSRGVSGIR
jgi:hypothetical protein